MSFEMNEDQRLAVDGLRRYLDDVIEPAFLAHGEGHIDREQMQQWVQGLADFGLMIAPFPAEYGGLGLDWQTHLRLFEEVVATSLDIAMPSLINAVGADLLLNAASETIRPCQICS